MIKGLLSQGKLKRAIAVVAACAVALTMPSFSLNGGVSPFVKVAQAAEEWEDTDLITNGDFSKESDWELGGSENVIKYKYVESPEGSDKWICDHIEINSDNGDIFFSISQEFTVNKGTYRVNFDNLSTDASSIDFSVRVKDGDSILASYSATSVTGWGDGIAKTYSTSEFEITTDNKTLNLVFSGSTSYKFWSTIDNVVLQKKSDNSSASNPADDDNSDDEADDDTIIKNGNFDNDIKKWTQGASSEGYFKHSTDSSKGAKFLRIDNYGNNARTGEKTLYQEVSLDPGSYKLLFDYCGGGFESGDIKISVGDLVSLSAGDAPGWDEWTTVTSKKFNVSSKVDNIKVIISVDLPDQSYAHIDNIVIEKVVGDTTVDDAEITVKKIDGLGDDFMLGTDISAIHSIYQSGATCKDFDGNPLTEEGFFRFLKNNGVNWVRIRVWNDPTDASGHSYGGGANDIEAAKIMGKYATDAGMKVLIDFHYSDFWADPDKQQAPKAWTNYSQSERETAVKTFTTQSLTALKSAGVNVGMVQVGNETNNGICGYKKDDNKAGYYAIFKAGAAAVKAVDKDILVALHFTNPEKGYSTIASDLDDQGVDYDVFASSYYPYWHGSLSNLKTQLNDIAKTYGKKVMVAETSYAWTLEDGDGHENTVRVGNNDDCSNCIYPYTVAGQAAWVRDVVNTVSSCEDGIGVFYWEAAWIPVGNLNNLSGSAKSSMLASNRTKWETYGSGWASSYSAEYDPKDAGKYYGGTAIDNQAFFDFNGKAIPSLRVYQYMRTGSESEVVFDAVKKPSDIEVNYSESLISDVRAELPEKATVILSDMSEEKVGVTWNNSDISLISDIEKYQVRGTLGYGGVTYTTVITVVVNPENLLGKDDSGFESGEKNWTTTNASVAKVTDEDPHSGSYGMHYYNTTAGGFDAENKKIELEPGEYGLSAYVQGCARDTGYIYVVLPDNTTKKSSEFTLDGWKEWKNPVIESIVISEKSTITIGVHVDYQAGGWGTIDDFFLYKTGNASSSGNSSSSSGTISSPSTGSSEPAVTLISVDTEKSESEDGESVTTTTKEYSDGSKEIDEVVTDPETGEVLETSTTKISTIPSGETVTTVESKSAYGSTYESTLTERPDGSSKEVSKEVTAAGSVTEATKEVTTAGVTTESSVTTEPDGSSVVINKTTQKNGDYTQDKTATTVSGSGSEATEEIIIEKEVKKASTITTTTYEVTNTSKNTVAAIGSQTTSSTQTISVPKTISANGTVYKVTKIEDGAFKVNKKATKATIGDNITSIGKQAFKGDTKLKAVTLGASVKTIKASAFQGDKALKKVTIGSKKVTSVGKNAFKGIKKDAVIEIKGSKAQYKKTVKLIKKSGIGSKVKFKRIK